MPAKLLSLIAFALAAAAPVTSANSPLQSAAQVIERHPPIYPETAIENGIEGLVLLQLEIEENGRPKNIELQDQNVNPMLAEAAIDTVSQWTFRPALLNGEPVSSQLTVPVRFQLLEPQRTHRGSVFDRTAPWIR